VPHEPRTWYPTAVNGRRYTAGSHSVLRPWGTVHLRAIGSTATLCGVLAVTWPMFFDLVFQPQHPSSCDACRVLMSSDQAA
jgi:hypothetical protein